MKKHLLIYGTLFLSFCALSQTTVTNNQLKIFMPGNTFIDNTDTVRTFKPDAGGPNKTWDFSSLNSHVKDTLSYIPVGGTPNAAMFTTSTVVEYSYADDSYDYYAANSSGVYLNSTLEQSYLDFAMTNPLGGTSVNKLEPPMPVLKFPLTYGSTWDYKLQMSQKAKSTAVFDSVRASGEATFQTKVDGWGSVKTPVGNFSNALRMVLFSQNPVLIEGKVGPFWTEIFSYNTIDTSYFWIADGQIVLSLSAERFTGDGSKPQENGPYRATYGQLQFTTGLESTFIPGVSFSLYPNPVLEQFQISGVQNVVSISNFSGNVIAFHSVSVSPGVFIVHPSDLKTGIYAVQVIDAQGIKKALKFSVVE